MIDVTSATTARSGDGYHHGDLPNALRCAAVDVIEERGVGGFSLREVARRAGVSHTAPAHHFGDVKGLLTSVAQEGFVVLHDAMASATAGLDDPVERLKAIGRAYVDLARTHRGHVEVMFRVDIVDVDDPDLQLCGLESYGVLEATVASLIESEHLHADIDHATWLCWSAMQGLVQLEPKLAMISELRGLPPLSTDLLIDRFTAMMVDGIRGVS